MMTAERISCLSGDNDLLIIRIPVIKTDQGILVLKYTKTHYCVIRGRPGKGCFLKF